MISPVHCSRCLSIIHDMNHNCTGASGVQRLWPMTFSVVGVYKDRPNEHFTWRHLWMNAGNHPMRFYKNEIDPWHLVQHRIQGWVIPSRKKPQLPWPTQESRQETAELSNDYFVREVIKPWKEISAADLVDFIDCEAWHHFCGSMAASYFVYMEELLKPSEDHLSGTWVQEPLPTKIVKRALYQSWGVPEN